MQDDLMLISEMDQDLSPLNSEQELLHRVKKEINAAADEHNIERAIKVCDYFQRAARLSGKSLAHALYTMYRRWNDFGISDEFIDYIYVRVGLHRHTVERYIKVARLLEESVPDDLRNAIENKGIQLLIPVAHAVSQGYDIEPSVWDRIASSTSYNEVKEVINRDVRHAQPREGALGLYVNRDGSILAYQGDQSPRFVGSLEVTDDDPVVQQAVERIVKNSGILRS